MLRKFNYLLLVGRLLLDNLTFPKCHGNQEKLEIISYSLKEGGK